MVGCEEELKEAGLDATDALGEPDVRARSLHLRGRSKTINPDRLERKAHEACNRASTPMKGLMFSRV
jgi:hypothetical protein